jgi:DNA-binding IclR family transcriptional regulator
MGESNDEGRTGSQTVDRATRLLRYVCAAGEAGRQLSEIVKQSGLTKPTVRRILIALIDNGLLEQDEGRKYFAGPETYALGILAAARFDIHRLARDVLVRIAASSEDAALLSIPRGSDTVCIAREEGNYPLRSHVLQPGHRHPLGCGAPGIALLSCLSDEEVEAVLAANAKRLATDYPRVTRDLIWRQVKDARKLGYALNAGLIFEGSWGVAVVVKDPAGAPVAALGIAGVEARFTKKRIDEMSRMLKAEGLALERRLVELRD